jgi:hypothetical protein
MGKYRVVMLLVAFALGTTTAYGQATRTWVSGVGDDANPCSRTAPCKTFAGAISKTAVNGEIDALDPGGFGAVTITKAITLDGGGGQVASILVSGVPAIIVNAPPGAVVIIRNLRLNGVSSGTHGIRFIQGGDLNVENCYIFGFTQNGIDIALTAGGSTVNIVNTVIKHNGNDGIRATTTVGMVNVEVNNTSVMVSGNHGIEAASGSIVGFDNGIITSGNNGATATAGGNAVISHTTIAYNTGTAYNVSGGNIYAYARGVANASNGTNRVHDNGVTGTPIYITEN